MTRADLQLPYAPPRQAKRLSRTLRRSRSANLARRRGTVGLSLLAAGAMGYIALYQTGLVRHLVEPPLPKLDADKVDASSEAYQWFGVPDGLLGLTSYALTATLAAMGGADRHRQQRWIPLLLGGKALADATVAAKLTWDQWAKHRAFCFWCLLATAATFGILPLVMPEVRQTLRTFRGGAR